MSIDITKPVRLNTLGNLRADQARKREFIGLVGTVSHIGAQPEGGSRACVVVFPARGTSSTWNENELENIEPVVGKPPAVRDANVELELRANYIADLHVANEKIKDQARSLDIAFEQRDNAYKRVALLHAMLSEIVNSGAEFYPSAVECTASKPEIDLEDWHVRADKLLKEIA